MSALIVIDALIIIKGGSADYFTFSNVVLLVNSLLLVAHKLLDWLLCCFDVISWLVGFALVMNVVAGLHIAIVFILTFSYRGYLGMLLNERLLL